MKLSKYIEHKLFSMGSIIASSLSGGLAFYGLLMMEIKPSPMNWFYIIAGVLGFIIFIIVGKYYGATKRYDYVDIGKKE